MQSAPVHRFLIAAIAIASLALLVMASRQASEAVPLDISVPAQALQAPAQAISAVELKPDAVLKAPKGQINIAIASTSEARVRGLSGTKSLSKDSGMLFVFPNAGVYGFWMKDMEYPIDIVWIGADRRVSSVSPGVSPDTFPKIFYPSAPSQYVLELNSGGASDYGIATGTKLVF